MGETFYRPPVLAARPGRRLGAAARRTAVAAGLAVASVLAFFAFVLVLRYHPRFAVTRVVLEGVPEIRRAEAEAVTDACIGQPLLFVDLDGPVSALSARPWVERASARRVVPGTIQISVTARPPVALARRDGELWAVDASGTFLGPDGGKGRPLESDWVVIDADPGDAKALARGAAFVVRLREDDPALYARLSEVDVRADGIAVVDREIRTRLLFSADAAEKGRAPSLWRAFLTLRPELERHSLLRNEADLRFTDRIILKAPAEDAARGKT